jgi:hypothetical protein
MMMTMTTTQLPLLPPAPDAASTLRLPERTRRLGLSQVAHARALLDAAARQRAEHEAAAERGNAAQQLAALRTDLRADANRAAA